MAGTIGTPIQESGSLKVAGSLVTIQVRAYGLLRMFGREGRSTPLVQEFAHRCPSAVIARSSLVVARCLRAAVWSHQAGTTAVSIRSVVRANAQG